MSNIPPEARPPMLASLASEIAESLQKPLPSPPKSVGVYAPAARAAKSTPFDVIAHLHEQAEATRARVERVRVRLVGEPGAEEGSPPSGALVLMALQLKAALDLLIEINEHLTAIEAKIPD